MNLTLSCIDAIYFCRLRLFYRAISSGKIGGFLGPEIRGSIGHQLKACMGCYGDQNEDCQLCPASKQNGCVYDWFYGPDTHQSKGMVLKFDHAFRGLKPEFDKGESLQCDITLIGDNLKTAHSFLDALKQHNLRLGLHGLSFKLIEAGFVDENGAFLPLNNSDEIKIIKLSSMQSRIEQTISQHSRMELSLHTPTEIRLLRVSKKREFLQNPDDFTFRLFTERMLGQIREIASSHCQWLENEKEGNSRYRTMIELSEKIPLVFHRGSWEMVGFRNKPGKKFGGLVGSFVYEGDFRPFGDLLYAAAQLGFGQKTTSGFGQISFRLLNDNEGLNFLRL